MLDSDWIDFRASTGGSIEVSWIHGVDPGTDPEDPPVQVHAYNEHTYILRQSMAVHHEAPFMYLLFGNEQALLVDTGASEAEDQLPLRATVDELVSTWLVDHPRDNYGLTVVHTHGHSDHTAGDVQFRDRPGTRVLPAEATDAAEFFGIDPWPNATGEVDLSGRVVEVVGAPGHHPTSIVLFDDYSGLLLTGDTLYPGRIIVNDMEAFTETMDRLAEFCESRTVLHVVGGHVEMTGQPGVDFLPGSRYQPGEASLTLPVRAVADLREAAHRVRDRPGVHVFDDYIVIHGKPWHYLPKYLLRLIRERAAKLLTRR